MKIYIFREGEVQGPFGRTEIFAGLRAGKFTDEDSACLEGDEDWQPLRELLWDKSLSVPLPQLRHNVEEAAPWSAPEPEVQLASEVTADDDGASEARIHLGQWLIPASLLLLFCGCMMSSFFVGRHLFLSAPRVYAFKTASVQSGLQRTTPRKDAEQRLGLSSSDPMTKPSLESDPASRPNATSLSAAMQTGQVASPPSLVSDETSLDARAASIKADAGTSSVKPVYINTSFAVADKTASASADSIVTDLFKTPIITPEDLTQVLEQRFSTAVVNSKLETSVKSEPNITIREGSFTLDTSLTWNAKVEVIYSIPLYNNVTPGPRASNVVMLGFWPGAMAPPEPTVVKGVKVPVKSDRYADLDRYARDFGYTAFTMHIVTRSYDDPVETYFWGGKEWVDIVFRAQDELTRMFRMPPKKLMLKGHSLGATFVERVAAARPDKVAAVVFHGASEIAIPKQHSDTLWYMQMTRGDSMHDDYNRLYNALLKLNDKALFDILPPNYSNRSGAYFYHWEGEIAKITADAFLEGFVNRRDSAGNVDPSLWPYARRKSNRINILSRTSPDLAQIPAHDREFLPSERFVRCAQALPVRLQSMILPTADGRSAKCFVGLPPLGRPRGVLIYPSEALYTNVTDLFNNMYYLAEKGYVVLCPHGGQSAAQPMLAATLNFVQNAGVLRGVPTVFIASGEMGSRLWESITRSTVDPKAIALVGFRPRQAFDESQLPIGAHPVRCPVFFIEEEKRMLAASTSEQAREVLADAQMIDNYISTCRERHQMARIISISDSGGPDASDAQRTIEAVDNAFADVVDGKRGFIIR